MLAHQRHREILHTLERQGAVKVADLAPRLAVTEETIRRDLLLLEKEQKLRRTHGGALPSVNDLQPLPYTFREMAQVREKQSIARRAVMEIEEDDVLFLDGSTTAYQLARIFPDIRCTVLTQSEPIFQELVRRSNVELLSTGGVYDRVTACFVGPLAEQLLTSIHLTKAFIGCKGLDFKRGFSDTSVRHMNLKRSVIHWADKVIILADHSKLDSRARYFFAGLPDVDGVITDPAVSQAHRQALERAGVKLLFEKNVATAS